MNFKYMSIVVCILTVTSIARAAEATQNDSKQQSQAALPSVEEVSTEPQ